MTDLDQPSVADGELTHRQVMIILSGLLLGIFLAAVDGTIVSTALPTIVGELGGFDQLTWVVTAYFVTSTAATPLYGKVSDLLGRRIVYQFAIVSFIGASILAGFAQNMTQLVLFRALQGVGGGGLQSLGFIVMSDIVSPRDRGRYMGYFTGTYALSGLAGPLLGGLIVDSSLGWRWIFFLNLPIGLITLAVISTVLRLPHVRIERRIDWEGAGLLVVGVSALLIAASIGGDDYAWSSPTILGLIALGLVASVGFVWWEGARAEEPILPLRLFSNDIVAVGMILSVITGAALMSTNVFLPLFLQVVTGTSATESGLILSPMMVGLTLASIVAGGRLSKTGRYKPLIRTGPIVALAGISGLTLLTTSSPVLMAVPFVILMGIGMGMLMPPLSVSVQNAVPFTDLGVVTAATAFFRSLGQTIGVALYGALMAAKLRTELAERIDESTLGNLDLSELTGSPKKIRELPTELQTPVVESIADSVHLVYLAAVPMALLVVAVAFRLREIPLRTQSPMAEAKAAAAGE
ncbi:MAG: MDR family MFS transporter [Acidimicrobiales bacterium]